MRVEEDSLHEGQGALHVPHGAPSARQRPCDPCGAEMELRLGIRGWTEMGAVREGGAGLACDADVHGGGGRRQADVPEALDAPRRRRPGWRRRSRVHGDQAAHVVRRLARLPQH